MKDHVKKVISNPVLAGSFFLFSGGMLANLFNFLFNLLMSRNLAVSEYGILTSLISVITLLSIPAGALSPTVVSVAGKYFAEGNNKLLHTFYFKLLRPLVVAGVVVFVMFLLFSKQAGEFFNIENTLFLSLVMLSVALSYIVTLNNSFAQAKLSFRYLSASNSFSALFKVLISFVLVMLGWGLTGALLGFLISLLLPLMFGVYYLRKIVFYSSENLPHISYRSLLSFGLPSAVIVFCLSALISTDILLVKYFFNAYQTGQYAGLSLVGRVVFYVSAPVGTVMFPVIVNRYTRGQNYKSILYAAIALVGLSSSLITTFFFIFPEFTVMFFLKRGEYLAISTYIGRFGIFTTLYSILSLFSYYFLSIKQVKFAWVLLSGVVLQVVLIAFFHSDFGQIINVSIFVSVLLLVCAFYLFLNSKKNVAI